MSIIWTIAKRELRSFFDSLLAYIVIIVFLIFTGLMTWLIGHNTIFFQKQASMQVFFGLAYWALFFLIPALTMKSIAEERSIGTLEMILTKPVSDIQLLLGKFIAVFILVSLSLALTLPYYITVASLGPVDHAATILGYIGMLLMSMAYISIGLLASSFTNNQIVAFLVTLFIGVFFYLLFDFISNYTPDFIGKVLNYLSFSVHYESLSRGVIDSNDLIYFLSVSLLGLFGAEMTIAGRNTTT